MKAYVSGQAQFTGMGKDLYESSLAKDLFEKQTKY
jgi:hypothetical protein